MTGFSELLQLHVFRHFSNTFQHVYKMSTSPYLSHRLAEGFVCIDLWPTFTPDPSLYSCRTQPLPCTHSMIGETVICLSSLTAATQWVSSGQGLESKSLAFQMLTFVLC